MCKCGHYEDEHFGQGLDYQECTLCECEDYDQLDNVCKFCGTPLVIDISISRGYCDDCEACMADNIQVDRS